MGEGGFIRYVMKISKFYYMPGTTLEAINSISSFRTNLRADVGDKYLIEKTCSLGPSRHQKLI